MAGSPNPNIYLSDHYPTPPHARVTNVQLGSILLDVGWPKDREVLATAIAVVNAESLRDHRGYLAYCDLKVDRHSGKGLALRAEIDRWPKTITLTTFRHRLRGIGCELHRADIGLFQIGRPPHVATIADLTDKEFNCRLAWKIYVNNGRTFRPWAAYSTPRKEGEEPPYTWYMDDATAAVKIILR